MTAWPLVIMTFRKGPHLSGSLMSACVTFQGRGGTQACTAGEKGLVLMSFSSSSTSVSVSRSPMVPSVRT